MNRLAFAAIALAAGLAYGIGGDYALGFGPFNTSSNSNYAATFGHSAGYAGWGNSFTTLIGTFAGCRGGGNTGDVGLGYSALYGASNCVGCVAIGANAGRGWKGANGWVQIGNALIYTNDYLSIGNGLIKARRTEPASDISTADINGIRFSKVYEGYGNYVSVLDANIIHVGWNGNVVLNEFGVQAPSLHCGNITVNNGYVTFMNYDNGEYYADYELILRPEQFRLYSEPVASNIGRSEVCTIGEADSRGVLRFESGGLSVYTNGVKAGTLTFTPAQ